MNFTAIKTSEARKTLPKMIREVDENGKIYVFTVHGESKAAMIDLDLLEELIENTEYGISANELIKRSNEETLSLADFKKQLNV